MCSSGFLNARAIKVAFLKPKQHKIFHSCSSHKTSIAVIENPSLIRLVCCQISVWIILQEQDPMRHRDFLQKTSTHAKTVARTARMSPLQVSLNDTARSGHIIPEGPLFCCTETQTLITWTTTTGLPLSSSGLFLTSTWRSLSVQYTRSG